jgi:nitronate monooxygenase/enoyl-[acyl-carrier protein] reductase II
VRTPLCELLDIEAPIIGAPFGPWDEVDLAAAVCNAGALGSLGTAVRPVEDLRRQWARLRSLTDRSFAINHTARPFDEAAFAATLAERPAAISFHLAVPADLIDRAHEAGIRWIQQVTTLDQACAALEAGADVIVAQGGEAGGHAGPVGTMVLVPQVVDVAASTPVVAAGGIVDGRGLAAALALGAQGVSVGTRFLATSEMAIADEWKRRILAADAVDAIRVVNDDLIMPPYTIAGFHAEPRALDTPLIQELRMNPERVQARAEDLAAELVGALLDGRGHEYLPFAGQSAGLIYEILPAGEIVRAMVDQADATLARLGGPAR